MRQFIIALSLVIAAFTQSLVATPAQVIIVPNAEIDALGNLTQEGLERAGALAAYLTLTPNFTSFGEPVVIFAARPTTTTPPNNPTDNTQACIRTIAPTAEALRLPIHSGLSKQQTDKLATLILNNPLYDGKNVLICWRTDGIQALAAALGVASPPTFPVGVYNITWVITYNPTATLQIFPQDLLASDNITSCGCGTVVYPSNTGEISPEPIIDSPAVWSFITEPTLHPMKITVNTNTTTSPGSIFVGPYTGSSDALYGQTGALIMDNLGNPIWFRGLSSPNLVCNDFRTQTLNSQPVLTFWQGTLATAPVYTDTPSGSSEPGSCFYILDNTYKVVGNVTAQNGFISDVHEFLITPSNTALLFGTKIVPMDLTSYGGPQNGYVLDYSIQEIDIATNQLLFFWDALANIPLTASYQPASSATESSNVWDAYHLNSISLTDSTTQLVVSSRNTWTIYRIDKPTGNIVWQLGGKNSSFTIPAGADFSWQHDARFFTGNIITMFDDNCCEDFSPTASTPPARGLTLQLNLVNMTASATATYYHDPLIGVGSQGNMQTLSNSNVFIGWGQEPYISEYSGPNTTTNPGLNTVYDAEFPGQNLTYRAYRFVWTATPYYPPSIAVIPGSGGATVYASWNGSTETASWQVYAGSTPTSLTLVGSSAASGFETPIVTSSSGPYFQVLALDGSSTVIGRSDIISISN